MKNKKPDQSDIERYIREKDDFYFEISVLNLGTENNFKCRHSGSYIDFITKKIRQFDLQFEKHFENFHIYLPIECKNIKLDHPILISQTPRKANESFHEILVSVNRIKDGSRMNLSDFSDISIPSNKTFTRKIFKNNRIFPIGEYVGKSLIQISIDEKGNFKSKNDEVYDKWIQVFGQANSLLNKAAKIYEENSLDFHFSVLFPILVIPDNCLWVINYDLFGNIVERPKLVDYCELYFGLESEYIDIYSDNIEFSHLYIFTISGLSKYLKRFNLEENLMKDLFPQDDILDIMSNSHGE
jgi:hypothetical protein